MEFVLFMFIIIVIGSVLLIIISLDNQEENSNEKFNIKTENSKETLVTKTDDMETYVSVKFDYSDKLYTYIAPPNKTLHNGDKIFINTPYGISNVTIVKGNFRCPRKFDYTYKVLPILSDKQNHKVINYNKYREDYFGFENNYINNDDGNFYGGDDVIGDPDIDIFEEEDIDNIDYDSYFDEGDLIEEENDFYSNYLPLEEDNIEDIMDETICDCDYYEEEYEDEDNFDIY